MTVVTLRQEDVCCSSSTHIGAILICIFIIHACIHTAARKYQRSEVLSLDLKCAAEIVVPGSGVAQESLKYYNVYGYLLRECLSLSEWNGEIRESDNKPRYE